MRQPAYQYHRTETFSSEFRTRWSRRGNRAFDLRGIARDGSRGNRTNSRPSSRPFSQAGLGLDTGRVSSPSRADRADVTASLIKKVSGRVKNGPQTAPEAVCARFFASRLVLSAGNGAHRDRRKRGRERTRHEPPLHRPPAGNTAAVPHRREQHRVPRRSGWVAMRCAYFALLSGSSLRYFRGFPVRGVPGFFSMAVPNWG